MFYEYSRALTTIGLVLISFGERTRSKTVIGLPPDRSVSPLKDPRNNDLRSNTSDKASAKFDANDDTFWHCGSSPKLMIIETNHPILGDKSSDKWNHYYAVSRKEKWRDTNLTWSVLEYANFPKNMVNTCMTRALNIWSEAAPRLKFKRLKRNPMDANFRIKFVDKMQPPYNDKTIAHAFYPEDAYWRFMEFRTNEEWTLDSYHGSSVLIIATHEFGHALGLYHSDIWGAIMHKDVPFKNVAYFTLHLDDIAGIQYLYGDGAPRGGIRARKKAGSKSTSSSSSTFSDGGGSESGQSHSSSSSSVDSSSESGGSESGKSHSSSSSSDDDGSASTQSRSSSSSSDGNDSETKPNGIGGKKGAVGGRGEQKGGEKGGRGGVGGKEAGGEQERKGRHGWGWGWGRKKK